ncbi:MAG: hypothetical protein J6W84_06145 [Bacteroidales bacterium]|nr:hypothetical protein [Bacteroidales bacterium]
MANSIFNALGGNTMPNGLQNFMQMFNQFKSNFHGNPQEEVQKLLNSGRISQEQFNQYAQQATQIQNMMNGNK